MTQNKRTDGVCDECTLKYEGRTGSDMTTMTQNKETGGIYIYM